MQETRVASRYAKSLLQLTEEKGELEKAYEDMQLLANTCKENKELILLLKSPIIKQDKKKAILNALFSSKMSKVSESFINIIVSKGRENYLPAIAKEFLAQYKVHKGIQTATVSSAVKLDEKTRKQIEEMVKKSSGSEVELLEKVDKDLIGGFVLRVGDNEINASIKSKLHKLSQEFSKNEYIKDY